jgi:urea transport system substrate-binding protein
MPPRPTPRSFERVSPRAPRQADTLGPGWLLATAVALAAGLGWLALDRLLVDRSPIVVGILHSQTGSMAVSERAMIEAEVLALEQIDRSGGLLGRPVRWVIADGASDWPTFAREADRLIREERVAVIFGCWTSACRKGVLPIVEAADHLLVYPMAYEGMEQSPNIVYTGAAPNQQITPAVQWCHDTLGARRFFLVGSDYIWPRCVNAIATDKLRALGDEVVGEAYVQFGSTAVGPAIDAIVAARPDVILASVVGDSAIAFARGLRAAGISATDVPLVTFALGEAELADAETAADMAGDFAAWNYFQSLDRPENRRFVEEFKARYGAERAISDVMVAAANSVRLWAQAVREAGTPDVRNVRQALRQQSLAAPEGIIAVDPDTQHTWRPVFIGRIRSDGQFDIIWSSQIPVRPVPFPLSRSRSEWERFVADLSRAWGGRWTNPGVEATAGGRGDGELVP